MPEPEGPIPTPPMTMTTRPGEPGPLPHEPDPEEGSQTSAIVEGVEEVTNAVI